MSRVHAHHACFSLRETFEPDRELHEQSFKFMYDNFVKDQNHDLVAPAQLGIGVNNEYWFAYPEVLRILHGDAQITVPEMVPDLHRRKLVVFPMKVPKGSGLGEFEYSLLAWDRTNLLANGAPTESIPGKVAPKASDVQQGTCRWMYGDVGLPGSSLNPLRWSESMIFQKAIDALVAVDRSRSITLDVHGHSSHHKFENPQKAIEFLKSEDPARINAEKTIAGRFLLYNPTSRTSGREDHKMQAELIAERLACSPLVIVRDGNCAQQAGGNSGMYVSFFLELMMSDAIFGDVGWNKLQSVTPLAVENRRKAHISRCEAAQVPFRPVARAGTAREEPFRKSSEPSPVSIAMGGQPPPPPGPPPPTVDALAKSAPSGIAPAATPGPPPGHPPTRAQLRHLTAPPQMPSGPAPHARPGPPPGLPPGLRPGGPPRPS